MQYCYICDVEPATGKITVQATDGKSVTRYVCKQCRDDLKARPTTNKRSRSPSFGGWRSGGGRRL